MSKIEIKVDNVMCDGCATTIIHGLTENFQGINVMVDVENGIVKLSSSKKLDSLQIDKKLSELGFPKTKLNDDVRFKSIIKCIFGN
ncbi:MAG: heavy-metal-associated domain-containing protein [Saprospiraceae bacterium]|nr:heavy-metal-associated domain-containing protein [Saprospiraceae bacterium]